MAKLLVGGVCLSSRERGRISVYKGQADGSEGRGLLEYEISDELPMLL